MILRALLRSEIFRALPLWLGLLTVNAGLWVLLFLGRARYRGSEIPGSWLVLVGWCSLALFLAVGPVRRRCRPLDLALPVSARRLRAIHLASVVLAAAAVAAAYVAVVALLGSLSTGGARLGVDVRHLALLLGAGILFATVLLDSFRPSLASVPVTRGYAAWVAVVLGGTGALLAKLSGAPAAFAVAPAVGAAAGALALFRVAPGAFSLAPAEPEGGAVEETAVPAAGREAERAGPRGAALARALLRLLVLGPKAAAMLPFVALLGVVAAGGLGALVGDPDAGVLRLWQVPLAGYVLFISWSLGLESLHLLDPLPLRRRALFALLALPPLLVFGFGYGAGAALGARAESRREPLGFVETRSGLGFEVPLRFHALAPDGNPPVVGSPWGETFAPRPRYPAVLWSRAALYNPFSFGPESSRGFAALQIARAVEAVCGRSVPAGEIADRYLGSDGGGRVVPREGGLTLRKDHPGLLPRAGGPVAVLVLPLAACPWLILLGVLLRAFRPFVSERARLGVYFGIVVAFVLGMIGLTVAMIAGALRPPVAEALLQIAADRIGASPLSTAAGWIACAAVLAAAYRFAETRFVRMEIPARPTIFTLVGRQRERA